MPRVFPSPNISVDQLRQQSSRGAVGQTSPATNIGAGANMRPVSPASGGATAGLAANPSRVGNPPMHSGAPAMGSGQPPARGGEPTGVSHPRDHALTLASLAHLKKVGHAHPNHHAVAATAKAGIASTRGAGVPKPRGGFGALGGAGGGVTQGNSFLSGSGPSNIPGAGAPQGGPPMMED